MIWVSWTGAKKAHAASFGVRQGDVRNGSFPLECGLWAPDPMDRMIDVRKSSRSRCARCLAVREKNDNV